MYTAQIRLRRQGRIVYQETQSFDFKQTARAWLLRNGFELFTYCLGQFQVSGVNIDLLPGQLHREHDSFGFRWTCKGLTACAAPIRLYVGDGGGARAWH